MKEYTENRVTPRLVLAAAIVLGLACQAQAQALELQIVNGLVTLDARGVSLKQILAAWTEVGGAQIINADRLSDAPVTLQFTRASERVVLEALLRDVAGYVLGPKSAEATGNAGVGRIVILPTSSPVGSINASLPSGFAPFSLGSRSRLASRVADIPVRSATGRGFGTGRSRAFGNVPTAGSVRAARGDRGNPRPRARSRRPRPPRRIGPAQPVWRDVGVTGAGNHERAGPEIKKRPARQRRTGRWITPRQ